MSIPTDISTLISSMSISCSGAPIQRLALMHEPTEVTHKQRSWSRANAQLVPAGFFGNEEAFWLIAYVDSYGIPQIVWSDLNQSRWMTLTNDTLSEVKE